MSRRVFDYLYNGLVFTYLETNYPHANPAPVVQIQPVFDYRYFIV